MIKNDTCHFIKTVTNIGNSLGIILDKPVLYKLSLQKGDKVEVVLTKIGNRKTIKCPWCKQYFILNKNIKYVLCPHCNVDIDNVDSYEINIANDLVEIQ